MAHDSLLFGSLFDRCPKSWDVVAFEEAIDFQEGPGIMAADFHAAGVPLIRLSGVQRSTASLEGCNFLDPEKVARRWNHFRLKRGDLLVSTSATIGMVSEVDRETEGAIAYTGLIRLRPRNERVCAGFIKYFASSSFFIRQAEGMAAGSVLRHFGPSHLRQMAFPIPPLPEQRAIASVLGALDDKIDLNRRMCQTLEEMARALFKSWFVDFDPVRAKMEGRDPGLPKEIADLFPSRLVDSELGPIPEGWRVVSLSDLVEVSKGASYTSAELQPSSVALLSLKSFARGGGYRDGGLKPFVGRYKESQVVACGDVVMPCTDVTQAAELIGRTARVPQIDDYEIIVASTDVLVLRPSVDSVPRSWLALLGRSPKFVAAMLAHSTGTTVLHLAREAIPNFLTAVPPTTLLARFDEHVSPLMRRSDLCQNQSRTLAALRDTLLPKLISGELRIPASLGSIQETAI